MTEETIVAPVETTQNPSTDPAPTTETPTTETPTTETPAAAGEEGHQQEGQKADERTPEQKFNEALRRAQLRHEKRTAKIVSEREFERQRAAELERRLSQYEQPAATAQTARHVDPEAVQREAQAIVAAQEFVKTCNALVAKGRAEFPDFDVSLATLSTVTGPLIDDRGRPEPLLTAVLDGADDPHKVLRHLATHPDVAADLIDLPATRQAARIARLEASLKEPARKPSQAPAPLTPVKPVVVDTAAEPDASDTDRWIAWRNKQASGTRHR